MRRETQNVMLILVGGALLRVVSSGAYLRYVKPSQGPWILAAGIVMIALAATGVVLDITSRGREQHHGHEHSFRSSWLLVLPVLAIFLVAPPALGADSVNRAQGRAAEMDESQAQFPPLPTESPLPMRLTDFVTRAGWDRTHSLRGRSVELTGFVVHRGADVQVARLVITCCAADAKPMAVTLRGVPDLAQNDWITVNGILVEGQGERYLPVVQVQSVRTVTAPREPYEY